MLGHGTPRTVRHVGLGFLLVLAAASDTEPLEGARAPELSGACSCRATADLRCVPDLTERDCARRRTAARFGQNPQDMEVRPSHMLLVRRADVLVRNGLEEDAWIDVIVRGAANPGVLRGSPNVVEASQGIRVLKVPAGHVDRSLGDVHPLGSPHYTLDPDNAVIVTGNIAAGLAPGAPEHARAVEGHRAAFFHRLPPPPRNRAPRCWSFPSHPAP